jgi:hypothetical protein
MIGMGMLMYGKRSGALVPLGSGLGLMVMPYFLPTATLMLVVCGALTLLPLILKNA